MSQQPGTDNPLRREPSLNNSRMIRQLDHAIVTHPVRTRMPFRYGIATLTELPLCLVFIKFDWGASGTPTWGMASDLLPPKWFKKDPDQPADEELEEMKWVISQAVTTGQTATGETPFEFWLSVYQAQLEWGRSVSLPPLLANFGTALVERALLDAFCRYKKTSLSKLLFDSDTLGIKPGEIHSELGNHPPGSFLQPNPLTEVSVRHTVGFGDPLSEQEIKEGRKLEDSLPQSLEKAIRHYGLNQFKIKVKAREEEDLERMEAIASVVSQNCPHGYSLSIDGNEQFSSWDQFVAFWEVAGQRKRLNEFLQRVLFIEQPLSRDCALAETGIGHLPDGGKTPPVIIDESDGEASDFRTALELGYRGTSHKNCKGIFKGIAHRCLINRRNRSSPAKLALLMSGEDLANIGPVAINQDLVLQSILGNKSVERNGHHYFNGLAMLPPAIRELVSRRHPELYRLTRDNNPTLNIRDGKLSVSSLHHTPFGTHYTPEEIFMGFEGKRLPR